MVLTTFTSHPRRLQQRLSVLLSMVVCLWMYAAATHFHTPLDDASSHHTAKELCGFCASLPSAAAAPAVRTFVPTRAHHHIAAPAEILAAIPTAPAAAYRSRAPPVV